MERLLADMQPNSGSALYDLLEHRHRFAVWAAARAAQRGWKSATTDRLQTAIEACGVREFVERSCGSDLDPARFDELHRRWCDALMQHLQANGGPVAPFGRVAKLLAVYLKVMVVLGPESDCALAQVAHPPIDRIMLQNIAKCDGFKNAAKADPKWTDLTDEEYYCLIGNLRAGGDPGEPFWKLERFWTVTSD